MVVLRIIGLATPNGWTECADSGRFVSEYYPDGYRGRGKIVTSERVANAAPFKDAVEAHAFWRQQSVAYPLREDGEPNCPLTAFTVELLQIAS